MQTLTEAAQESAASSSNRQPTNRVGGTGSAVLRVALGVIIVVTWWSNVTGDLYTAEGLRGFFNWLSLSAEEGGNGSSLGFVHSFLDSAIGPIAGPFGFAQGVLELLLGLALVFGVATRAAALGAAVFFSSIFLAYFGGEEWIWTYVLLIAGSVAVFLDWGGRRFGLDAKIASIRGESPGGLIW